MRIGRLIESLDLLEGAADWGYDYAEVVPWLLGPDEDDAEAESAVRARIRAAPLPVATMCGFLPDPERKGLMVVGPRVDRERLRGYTTRVFDRMQRLGIDVIGFGSGGARTVPEGFPVDRALGQVRDFLRMCADLGERRGVRVAVEPYNRRDSNLLNTVPEALRVVRELDRHGVRLMADFFHMRLNGEELDELELAGPYLIHAHIAEPGRGHPETTPADHRAFVAALRRAGYDGRLTQTGALPAYRSPAEAAAALKRAALDGGAV
ncbi:MAG TPA: sugar phosphate isomerase/epimerase family protein [Chloroflexota bacterium]|nr:sugar phosphate isomerase/epimerase family protein [Chloroflexota bacterium]